MALPYLDNPATLDEMTVQELDGLVTKVNTFLRQQHTDQGGHGAITAENVVVDGPVTVRDELKNPSSFVRNLALGTRIDIQSTPTDQTPYLTIRYRNALNQPLTALVRIGNVGGGPNPTGPGLRLAPEASAGRHAWEMLSASVSAGPALLFDNVTNGDRPLLIVWTGGHYEVRRDVSLAEVWLGGPGGFTQRFERGYIESVFQHGRAAAMGDWTAVPYNASNFFSVGAGTAWGVEASDVLTHRYALVGQTLHYMVMLQQTSVTGTPNELIVTLPTGWTVAAYFASMCLLNQGAGNTSAVVYSNPGEAILHVSPLSGLWASTVNATTVLVNVTCEVDEVIIHHHLEETD
jgi:hypothetical protein